jgi:hypothetical protein
LGGQCWDVPTLGLLLPILSTNGLASTADPVNASLNDQYDMVAAGGTPTTANGCCNNLTTIHKCTGLAQIVSILVPNGTGKALNGLCPNGDESQSAGGTCWTPVDDNGDPNCWSNLPPQLCNGADCTQGLIGAAGATTGGGPDVRTVDPRVFNLMAYTLTGGQWVAAPDDAQRPITGAYYRIHTSQSLLTNSMGSCATTAGTAVCAQPNAHAQVGCLVQASPCSLGYGASSAGSGIAVAGQSFGPANAVVNGKTTATCTQGAGSLLVKAVPNAPACVTSLAYPLWRKIYWNSSGGFGQMGALNELRPQGGFLALPSSVHGGSPYCEDFNEFMECAAPNNGIAVNGNACANNPPSLPGAAGSTACGNGIVEPLEECDQGTAGYDGHGKVAQLAGANPNDPTTWANGYPGSACSMICRRTK